METGEVWEHKMERNLEREKNEAKEMEEERRQ
jgi:hypothetical protein